MKKDKFVKGNTDFDNEQLQTLHTGALTKALTTLFLFPEFTKKGFEQLTVALVVSGFRPSS